MSDEKDLIQKTLDKHSEVLDNINQTLVKQGEELVRQHETLKHHMYRTELAEEGLELLQEKQTAMHKSIKDEIKPIKDHVAMFNGVIKFLGILSVIAGLIITISKFI